MIASRTIAVLFFAILLGVLSVAVTAEVRQQPLPQSPEIVSVVLSEKRDVFVNGKPSKRYPNLSGVFIKMPKPHYPRELRRLRLQGFGIFRMYINERGLVTDIKIRKSTGRCELDSEVLKALVRWRAKPGPRREIDEPVAFVLDKR